MSESQSHLVRLAGRRTLGALLAVYAVALVGLGVSIWFEAPGALASGLYAATLILAVLGAICAGRTFAHEQESVSFRERASMSGRGAGVFACIVLVAAAIACKSLIAPRTWPATVAEAVLMLDAELSAEGKRKLAYAAYDDLGELHSGWGASIRERFGMKRGNERLLQDCDPEYVHADVCSTVIISRLWKKARAELPPKERAPLDALDVRMAQVRLKPHQFERTPLKDVAAYFNDAIGAQLAPEARFTIHFDPADADEPVSAAWYEMQPISLREALGYVAAATPLHIKKTPPDLVLERD